MDKGIYGKPTNKEIDVKCRNHPRENIVPGNTMALGGWVEMVEWG